VKRVPVAASVLVGGIAGWTVAASHLFFQFGGLSGKPCGAPGALRSVPLAGAAIVVVAVWRFRGAVSRRVEQPKLYGDSRFASEAEQRSGHPVNSQANGNETIAFRPILIISGNAKSISARFLSLAAI
jgi:hypothetical protein